MTTTPEAIYLKKTPELRAVIAALQETVKPFPRIEKLDVWFYTLGARTIAAFTVHYLAIPELRNEHAMVFRTPLRKGTDLYAPRTIAGLRTRLTNILDSAYTTPAAGAPSHA